MGLIKTNDTRLKFIDNAQQPTPLIQYTFKYLTQHKHPTFILAPVFCKYTDE